MNFLHKGPFEVFNPSRPPFRYCDVIEVYEENNEVMIRGKTRLGLFIPTVYTFEKNAFDLLIFHYKKFISRRDEPLERWEGFEVRENGHFSNAKMDRIIKGRIRPEDTALKRLNF